MAKFKKGDKVRFLSEEEFRDGVGARVSVYDPAAVYEVAAVIPGSLGELVILGGIGGVFAHRLELVPASSSEELKPGDTILVEKNHFMSSTGVGEVILARETEIDFRDAGGVIQVAPREAVKKVAPLDGEPPKPENEEYFSRKADKGKADYTLLPAGACAYVLGKQTKVEGHDYLCDNNYYADRALASMFAFRETGDAEHLAEAFSYGAAILGMSDGVGGVFGGVVEVLEFGAKKYDRDSWQTVQNGLDRYWAAAMRHLDDKFVRQQLECDEESGLSHVKHFLCNVLFLVHLSGATVETEAYEAAE